MMLYPSTISACIAWVLSSARCESALTLRLEEQHRGGHPRVERCDVPHHRYGHERIAVLASQPSHARALGADDDRRGPRKIDRVVAVPRAGIKADTPDPRHADDLERLREVGHGHHREMLGRAC